MNDFLKINYIKLNNSEKELNKINYKQFVFKNI